MYNDLLHLSFEKLVLYAVLAVLAHVQILNCLNLMHLLGITNSLQWAPFHVTSVQLIRRTHLIIADVPFGRPSGRQLGLKTRWDEERQRVRVMRARVREYEVILKELDAIRAEEELMGVRERLVLSGVLYGVGAEVHRLGLIQSLQMHLLAGLLAANLACRQLSRSLLVQGVFLSQLCLERSAG